MVRALSPLGQRLASLERLAPQTREESTLRQDFLEALNSFLNDKGIAQRGVRIVLDQRLITGKPDARVGAIVFEVKLPEPAGAGIDGATTQAQRYIREFSTRYPAKQSRGVAYDGLTIRLLDETGHTIASGRPSTFANRLQSWLISLAGEVIQPDDFVARLGPTSDLAHEMIGILWQSFHHFRQQVGFIDEVFKVWQGLYGVTTNLNEQAIIGLRRSATQMGITLPTKSHVEHYLFVVETYLAILLKLLVARVAVQQQLAPFASITELLQQRGPVITLKELENYIPPLEGVFEEDVFMWPVDAAAYDPQTERPLSNSLQTMGQNLDDVDLVAVGHDFLRLAYQRFLDPVARRVLGEFYTSPELVDETLDAVGYGGEMGKKIADITCGSGTFLVRAIERFLDTNRSADSLTQLRAITDNIIGVDIHPFAVAMARVNYILAIAELLPTARSIRIPIYWADSLLRLATPREAMPGMRTLINVVLPGLDEKFVLPDHRDIDWYDLMGRVKRAVSLFPHGTLKPAAVWGRFWQDAPHEQYLPYINVIRDFVSQIIKRHNRNRDMRWLPLLENTLSVAQLRQSCDFVVGNPPWVRVHNISPHIRQRLFAEYGFCMSAGWTRGARLGRAGRGFAQQIDYALPFVERGIEFLRPGGRLGFVITSKVMHALYGNALRKTLVRETKILRLSDYSLHATRLFEDATNYPLVIAFQVGSPDPGHEVFIAVTGPRGNRMDFLLPQTDLPLMRNDAESPWVLVPSAVRQTFGHMQTASSPTPDGSPRFRPLLGEIPAYQAQMGVKTGLNSVFIVKRIQTTENPEEVIVYAEGYYSPTTPDRERSKYVARLEKCLVRPLIRGENVEAWRYRIQDYILWTHDDSTGRVLGALPPKASEYFAQHAEALRRRSDHNPSLPLWQIFRISRQKLGHKIAWQRISSALECVYLPPAVQDPGGNAALLVPLDTAYIVSAADPSEASILAACLNSTPLQAYTGSFARRDRGAYHHYDAWVLGLVPLPEAISDLLRKRHISHSPLAQLEDLSRLLHLNPFTPNRTTLHHHLDGVVGTLYGLTPDELVALQDYFAFIWAGEASPPPPGPDQQREHPED